jgi:adenine C2-methylase RlmN of 23S rRNA A2503 and tRNA A37
MGLKRNLTSEEICDQILFWRQYVSREKISIRISNIVYMGMGEPFANKVAVFESIRTLTDKEIYGFGQRHLSVSTAGIVPGIREFADTFSQVNLAVSLHAPNNSLRETLMPIAKSYPLDKLMDVLTYYVKKTNRQLFIEYILLKDINDRDKDAVGLGNLLQDSFSENMQLIHVNLIVYNATGTELEASSKERARRFEKILSQFKISASIRKNLGQEIQGACGQLSTKQQR